MSVRVVFANRSGFDDGIGVVKAREERGSCFNIFRTTNHGRLSETFMNYEAKDLLRKHGRSVDHVLTYSERQITSGFDGPIGVFMAWEERGSCVNIFQTRNRGRISETIMNYDAKVLLRKHGRSVDHVIYILEETSQSDLKNLHELRGKRLVAQVSETRRFALYLLTGVDLMLELESSRHWRSVDHVLTYSGRKIAIRSQKP
ncbi:uncharacterized protein G2W53_009877 [Senna tora]|uniref:Uncharacterized protein n=1 Tax=Senna tora TaxID=362788 RepID=A0A834X016_9FABA|nr:uncharacterized protein G2W53_009877 [Senna tora]